MEGHGWWFLDDHLLPAQVHHLPDEKNCNACPCWLVYDPHEERYLRLGSKWRNFHRPSRGTPCFKVYLLTTPKEQLWKAEWLRMMQSWSWASLSSALGWSCAAFSGWSVVQVEEHNLIPGKWRGVWR